MGPSARHMGRVVMPRPVRWNGTFHQWLRRGLAARRIVPTAGANRCKVALVSCQSANGIAGNSSICPTIPARDGLDQTSTATLLRVTDAGAADRSGPLRTWDDDAYREPCALRGVNAVQARKASNLIETDSYAAIPA